MTALRIRVKAADEAARAAQEPIDAKSRALKAAQSQGSDQPTGGPSEYESDLYAKIFMKPTEEQVTEQWTRAIVKKGLALDFVDDTEVRKLIKMTANAGLSYTDAQKGDSKLSHRKMLTKKQTCPGAR